MKKTFTLIAICILVSTQAWCQIKIGGIATPPDSSAILELDGGINRGLLMPRMTTADIMGIANAAQGLMIYSVTDGTVYVRTDAQWLALANTTNPLVLPYYKTLNVQDVAAFKITSYGDGSTAISGEAGLNANGGASGLYGYAVSTNAYGIRGVGLNGIGGYFNSTNTHALVTDSGKVGFGTLTPKALVEINGLKASATGTTLLLNDDITQIKLQRSSIEKGFIDINNNDLRVGTATNNHTGKFVVRTDGSDRLFVDSAGGVSINNRLGVGLSQAQGRLHISGIGSSLTAVIVDDEDATIQLRSNGANKGVLQTSGNDLRLGTNFENSGGRLVFRSGGSDRAFLNFDGNFSVGTQGSAARLYVSSANVPFPAIGVDDEASATIQLRTNGVDKGFIQTAGDNLNIGTNVENATGKFVIRTGGVNRIFVDFNGNMSIGSEQVATGYKLSVDGKIMAEEMRIQNSGAWADYVFDPSYKLMPLNEVKNFIAINRHLPDIPEGKEIEDKGIPVGEMQTLMMQKIEELTLYLIKANEQIESLQKEVEALKKK